MRFLIPAAGKNQSKIILFPDCNSLPWHIKFSSMSKERREMERFDLGLFSRIQVQSGERVPEVMELVTQNVCAGGAYFNTSDPLPSGTRVSLNMMLKVPVQQNRSSNHLARIEISGKVIRSEESGMAIQFNNSYKIQPLGKKTIKEKT